MLLKVESDELSRFSRFVQRVNRSPIFWTLGLMVPVYFVSLTLAFMALLNDPFFYSPTVSFFVFFMAANLVMGYHWFFSRYQHSSTFAQILQFSAGLIPVGGGFFLVTISAMASQ